MDFKSPVLLRKPTFIVCVGLGKKWENLKIHVKMICVVSDCPNNCFNYNSMLKYLIFIVTQVHFYSEIVNIEFLKKSFLLAFRLATL